MAKKNRFPAGWNEERVRAVLQHYEEQTDEEAVAEDEAAFRARGQTVMVVPQRLVPAITRLISEKTVALRRRPNNLRILAARGRKQTKSRKPTARRGKIRG
jgi:hypothetical protein